MFYARSRGLGTLLSVITAVACATGGEAEEGRPASGGGANAGPTGGSGATDAGAAATGGSGGSSAITGGTGGSNVLPDASIAGMAGLGAAGVDGEAGASGAAGAGDAGCALVLEVCNGLDDDCDGRIDEDNPGGDNLCLVTGARGVCVAGATRCASGFISCVSLSAPSAEKCNGLDDDCNGTTDEGNPGGNQPCDTGLFGVCASGLTRCADGATECIPNVSAQTEVCNGVDDDCDGTPDDGFAGAGQPCTVPNQPPNTPCAQGLTNCLGGQSGCTQTRGPVPEQCNGIDDDCDGTLDNPQAVDGKTCSTGMPGACATGKTECSSGTLQCVPDVAPGTRIEVCNGIDDDCNGTVDDGATVGSDCAQRYSLSQNVAGWQCVNGACAVASCSGSFADCDGAAGNGCETNTGASPVNCGTCGKVCNATNGTPGCVNGGCTIACDTGYGNCDGIAATGCETPVSVDALNCGSCGRVCSTLNGTAACVSGACQIACTTGFANCDGSALNGCESNLASPTSCAACGRVCSTTNGTPTCVGGTCGIVCSAGWGNCDGNPDTGCEASLATTQNCGACGNLCSSQGGTPACTGGVCSGITCNAGLANCDGDPANGCEVNTDSSVANCGACGNACSATNGTPSCTGGVCTIACISGFGNCDGNLANGCETNLSVDAGHCGTCGNRCPTTNGTASCSSATCAITCNAGFGNCDGVIGNGCELDLRDSVVHCGSCTTTCSSANGTPSCQAGICNIACNTGFANCDGNATNGCEANLTSTAHCGACGRECSANNGIPSCSSGVCSIACSPGFADCDANVANGCETSVTSIANCGSCGNACSSNNGTPSCVGGTCSIACSSGFGNCDGSALNGCEANLQTSSSHCGFCGNACSSVNGTPSCNLGSCSIICGPSFGNCDGNVGNGCETNLSSNPAHCGSCTTVCGAQNGTPLCTSGTCSISCTSGFANCDGSVVNGCEANTNTDVAHCGSCTTVCSAANGSASCSAGSCSITCNAGFGNCDANLGNGCETSTVADPAHCGSCTNVCNSTGGTPQCVAGVCSGIGCSSGFADCDSNAVNGCETQLGTVQNCASCGNVCSTNHATASCSGGTCQITCAAGFSNCDGSLQNGCETDLNSVANCGGCGQACSAAGGTPSCASGQCSIACATGLANCDGSARTNGCEVDTRINVSHCGGCNLACSSANGTATCSGGNCSITCNPPFANCDGNARTNGCEVNTNTNLQHCGGCGGACSTANGTATCSSGACSIVCSAPFADCDGNARANGCEANVSTSPANCGGCGAACSSSNGTASCSTGTCAIACNAGYSDCDANARSDGCETNTDSDPMHCGSCTDTCSGVCTGGACTVASCPFGYVFCDDFEDGVADGWTKSGGTWSVLDEAGDKVYQGGGSEESWAGSSSTDQTVTAQVRVVQFGGTSDSYRAGIIARRSAPSDFYALQVRPDGMLSIRKGTTILSGCQIPSGVTVTQWFELKLQVSGPPASVTLRGFVNGGLKLTCTHTNGLASGQVGFVTYGTGTTARFDDITVSTP